MSLAMKKSSFIFAHPTAEQISTFNNQTSNLVSQKLVNFPENGKCKGVKTPARKKPSVKQLQALQSANEQRSLSAEVSRLKSGMLSTLENRAVYAETTKVKTGFRKEIAPAIAYFNDDPELMLAGLKKMNVEISLLIATVAITNQSDANYLQQKELQKLPILLRSLAKSERLQGYARNERANARYLQAFAIALCEGMLTMSKFTLMYDGLNTRYNVDAETKEILKKIGAGRHTHGTANAQSAQSKKLFRLLNLIDYVKGEHDTPVIIKNNALPIIEVLAGKYKH